jgi:hypothetical protein
MVHSRKPLRPFCEPEAVFSVAFPSHRGQLVRAKDCSANRVTVPAGYHPRTTVPVLGAGETLLLARREPLPLRFDLRPLPLPTPSLTEHYLAT